MQKNQGENGQENGQAKNLLRVFLAVWNLEFSCFLRFLASSLLRFFFCPLRPAPCALLPAPCALRFAHTAVISHRES
jgi:hypothetical protein